MVLGGGWPTVQSVSTFDYDYDRARAIAIDWLAGKDVAILLYYTGIQG